MLSSGSSANSYVAWTETSMILVDAGLSGKRTAQALSSFSLDIQNVDAIFITHEHTDHIIGAGVLSRRYGIPVYTTARTYFAAQHRLGKLEELVFIDSSGEVQMGDLAVESFPVPHDAADPVGFVIRHRGQKLVICSDLGELPQSAVPLITNPDVLIIESNYNIDMLKNGPYPAHLKSLIQSSLGHLSNIDTGKAITRILGPRTLHVLLAHISRNNNSPDQALQDVRGVLRFHGKKFHSLHTTEHKRTLGPFSCGGGEGRREEDM